AAKEGALHATRGAVTQPGREVCGAAPASVPPVGLVEFSFSGAVRPDLCGRWPHCKGDLRSPQILFEGGRSREERTRASNCCKKAGATGFRRGCGARSERPRARAHKPEAPARAPSHEQ